MSYKPTGKKKGNLTQYLFYLRHEGKKYTKEIYLPPSVVKAYYKKWELGIFERSISNYRLDDLVELYIPFLEKSKSQTMIKDEKRYLSIAQKYFKNPQVHTIKKANIEDFLLWFKKNGNPDKELSNTTVNRCASCLSYFFNWAIDRDYINIKNPLNRRRKLPEEVRVVSLTVDQMMELLSKCNTDYMKTFVLTALCTGMRFKEILNLKYSQVLYEQKMIALETFQTKAKRRRDFEIPQILIDHLKLNQNNSEWVIHINGRPLKNIHKSWYKITKTLSWSGADKLRIHDLRHVSATFLRYVGAELSEIQHRLGHSTIKMTERYAHYKSNPESTKIEAFTEALKGAV